LRRHDRTSASLVDLLDGSDLQRKIGSTLLIFAAGEDGWPHAATVSVGVGELLAVTSRELLLTLYAGSRTTAAMACSRRALLMTTAEGGGVKVAWTSTPSRPRTRTSAGGSIHCTAASARVDTVPYARVTHGIGSSWPAKALP
jgi:hypothetical protein